MKRYILTVLMSVLFLAAPAFAAGSTPQAKEKSEAEKYIQQMSRIKSSDIDYSYISAAMFKQMFSMLGAEVALEGVSNPLASIKSLRQFRTTGEDGYVALKEHMDLFLQEDEAVMGMELMALNREGGMLTAIYSGAGNILLVSDDESEISVVFIVGLTYDAFKAISENGINIGL